jgi:lysophospholipase L1-like esterase
MGRRSGFRPACVALEGRVVLSGGAAAPHGLAGHVRAQALPASVIPSPGNLFFDPPTWMIFHSFYVAEATHLRGGLAFLGDSLTSMWTDPTQGGRGLATWNALFAPLGAVDFGIMGDMTQNLLWRVEHGELAARPRGAVVMVGLNNLLHGDSPENTAAGVAAVVRTIHELSPRTHVLLLGVLPTGLPADHPLQVAIRQTDALLAATPWPAWVTYRDVGQALQAPDGSALPGVYDPGLIHLAPRGYQLLGGAIVGDVSRL